MTRVKGAPRYLTVQDCRDAYRRAHGDRDPNDVMRETVERQERRLERKSPVGTPLETLREAAEYYHPTTTVSMPLPDEHWISKRRPDGFYPDQPQGPMLPEGSWPQVSDCLKWAIRAATDCGRISDFDPDALIQNLRIALYRAPEVAQVLTSRAYCAARHCTAADYDMSIHTNPDAMAWAKFFCETFPDAQMQAGVSDDDLMGTIVGWFANAMMAMHDHLLGGPMNGDHAQYLLDHPETAAAASAWWDQMSPSERVRYVKAHPHSKFSDASKMAPRHALVDHLRRGGWRRKTQSRWTHPVSHRALELKRGPKRHVMQITHANGDVTDHATDSFRLAKRVASQMAKVSPARTSDRLLSTDGGSLHGHLRIPRGKKIPKSRLLRLARSSHPLSGRARMVLELQGTRDQW